MYYNYEGKVFAFIIVGFSLVFDADFAERVYICSTIQIICD